MRASKGDRLLVPGHRVGSGERRGEIVEVRGENGAPPYVVRWNGENGDRLFFPGADTVIEPRTETR